VNVRARPNHLTGTLMYIRSNEERGLRGCVRWAKQKNEISMPDMNSCFYFGNRKTRMYITQPIIISNQKT